MTKDYIPLYKKTELQTLRLIDLKKLHKQVYDYEQTIYHLIEFYQK